MSAVKGRKLSLMEVKYTVEEAEEDAVSALVREFYVGRSRLPKQILLP